MIVDNPVIQSVERSKKVTGKKKETVDNFRNIVDKLKSLIDSQGTMLDDFSEKNAFNYDVKCVSITK